MPATFAKKNRLLNSRQYQTIFKQPRKFFSKSFLVLGVKNTLSYARVGMVIKKKHIKLAVERNALKRVIRESFRKHSELRKASLDLVVIIHKDISKKNLATLLDLQWKNILAYYRKS